MNNTKTIQNVNIRVIEFIKKEIADKKERHAKMMESVNPKVIENLRSMKKIAGR
jgi:hypothetical protein